MSRRSGLARPAHHRTPAAPTVHCLRRDEPAESSSRVRLDAIGADRTLLAPPRARRARCSDGRRPRRSWGWLPRRTRGRALTMLAVSLVVLLGSTVAIANTATAAATPGTGRAATQPVPTPPPLPLPTVGDPCTSGSTSPICLLPPASPTPPAPSSSAAPCTGEGCIPQPTTPAPAPSNPGSGSSGDSGSTGQADCSVFSPGGCITNAINDFFRGIVTDALNPLLDLLSQTLLTTPTPDSLPRIGELWNNSWQILLASYGLLILIAGILVMAYETVQTRHSIKQIAPRVAVGFLAGALSLWLATKAIDIANALAQAVMGGGVDANSAGQTLKNLVLGSLNGGIFIIFIGIFLAGLLIALLVTYIVRVALTIALIAGAPLALMFHALPPTEGIARWWWRAFGGCLAIQVGQSLALITAMRVFLAPGGFTLFGPTVDGLVNLLVAIAIMYVLFKIPFWFLGSLRGGGGRSLVGSIVRGFIAYKTFGLLRGHGGGGGHKPRPSGGSGGRGPDDPYARARTTTSGQYLLPLTGVRRSRPTPSPKPAPASTPRPVPGRQLRLPLGDDWPEWKQHGSDGQYRLPLDVQRVKPTPPPPRQSGTASRPGGRSRGGTQLAFPFEPYKGNRATRSGQYPLPLDGVRHVAAATSTPPRRAPAAPATRPKPRVGQQLRLPLDLPKPARRTPPAPPKSGGKS